MLLVSFRVISWIVVVAASSAPCHRQDFEIVNRLTVWEGQMALMIDQIDREHSERGISPTVKDGSSR